MGLASGPIMRGLGGGVNHQRDIVSQVGKEAVDLLPVADVEVGVR